MLVKLPSLNQIIIIGELVDDPAWVKLESGDEVVNFVIVCNRRYQSSKTHKWKVKTLFVQVVAWKTLAQSCKEYLSRGAGVLVKGELEQSYWTSKDGRKRSKLQILAERVDFLSRKGDQEPVEGEVEHKQPVAVPE